MSGENYDSKIEKNVATYGYKTANSMGSVASMQHVQQFTQDLRF